MENPQDITSHYSRSELTQSITRVLQQSGLSLDDITPSNLKGVDEFHTGGVDATDHLIDQIPIQKSTWVLDIGCGIGGAARHIALNTGARVTGIDLTPRYIDTANELSSLVGMNDRTRFCVGSALELPFEDQSFDLTTMFHVGMNIDNKQALFKEAARVLRPGGMFALFDVMETTGGDLTYPLPWASHGDHSFVATPATYTQAATAVGFDSVTENNRKDFAIEFFNLAFARQKTQSSPVLNLSILMGPDTPVKLRNYAQLIKAGQLAPVEMIFRLNE
ncbi:MAG: class I SAM-dependent methyltransferase [Pseudomonadota bacterium]